MVKLLLFLILLVLFLTIWKEISEFRQQEEVRKKKLEQLKSNKDQLSNEELRSSSLEVKAEAVVRKAQNDAFEKEIKGLEEKET
jgi:predicted Holliday junction resolvase-like endonuclease